MDPADYLAHLRRELGAFAECLRGDLSAPVAHCGDWTLYDLADHLGRDNLWAALAVTQKRGDYEGPAAPRDPAALVTWFSATASVLLAALDTDPSASAWTIFPPPTAGFWQRRRCLETLVHRWDAEHALGINGQLDPALASVLRAFQRHWRPEAITGQADSGTLARLLAVAQMVTGG